MNEPRTPESTVDGEEELYFAFSATLRIFAPQLDLDDITRSMHVDPSAVHRAGDRARPKSRPRPHDMWMFSPNVPEASPLAEHIDALWHAVRPNTTYLLELKRSAKVDVFLGYRSNSDTAGFEIPAASLEIFAALDIPFSVSVIVA